MGIVALIVLGVIYSAIAMLFVGLGSIPCGAAAEGLAKRFAEPVAIKLIQVMNCVIGLVCLALWSNFWVHLSLEGASNNNPEKPWLYLVVGFAIFMPVPLLVIGAEKRNEGNSARGVLWVAIATIAYTTIALIKYPT